VAGGRGKRETPGIKNDKALSFVKAIQGRWKGTYFSEGKAISQALPLCIQMSRMASNIPRKRQLMDVFSFCDWGRSFMQNSKKEKKNPSSCPSSFHEGFSEPKPDGPGPGDDPELPQGD
jgi:hypothetical protein